MTVSTPVPLQHLINGEWIPGDGEELRSLNPARPDTVVAAGGSSTTADLGAEVDGEDSRQPHPTSGQPDLDVGDTADLSQPTSSTGEDTSR